MDMIAERAVRCARLFLRERKASVIALHLNCSERTVARIIKDEVFHAELDRHGYKGRRDFAGKARGRYRDSSRKVKAKKYWRDLEKAGVPRHKQANLIATKFGCMSHIARRWIQDWDLTKS